jgi:hypothetical protein
MRASRFCAIALFALGFPSCNLLRGQDAASAEAFLVSVYSHYQHGSRKNHSGIDFYGREAQLYFHSSLLALERADVKANGPGNVPAIDWDPICACQDWHGVWDLKIEVHIESPQQAGANVSFAVFNPKDRPADETSKLQITLVKEHGEWRIYDILDKSNPKFAPLCVNCSKMTSPAFEVIHRPRNTDLKPLRLQGSAADVFEISPDIDRPPRQSISKCGTYSSRINTAHGRLRHTL